MTSYKKGPVPPWEELAKRENSRMRHNMGFVSIGKSWRPADFVPVAEKRAWVALEAMVKEGKPEYCAKDIGILAGYIHDSTRISDLTREMISRGHLECLFKANKPGQRSIYTVTDKGRDAVIERMAAE